MLATDAPNLTWGIASYCASFRVAGVLRESKRLGLTETFRRFWSRTLTSGEAGAATRRLVLIANEKALPPEVARQVTLKASSRTEETAGINLM